MSHLISATPANIERPAVVAVVSGKGGVGKTHISVNLSLSLAAKRKRVMLLDADSSHTAKASCTLARQLNIRLLWLPKRSPELNPMDTLWGQAKDAICVNTQYTGIDEQADAFIAHVSGLSNREALRTSGVLSKHFWLRRTLSRYFCGPA